MKCKHCGCTDTQACPEGCWWVSPEVCSSCEGKIKERQILFTAPMVRALLDGTKTQTRRIVKPQPVADRAYRSGFYIARPGDKKERRVSTDAPSVLVSELCPYGQPGDRLWVRETWGCVNLEGVPAIAYRADSAIRDLMLEPEFHDEISRRPVFDYENPKIKALDFTVWHADLLSSVEGRWRPSIHMPRWVSRILLEITAVRVERLQDISEGDAITEGIKRISIGSGYEARYSATDRTWADAIEQHPDVQATASAAYRELWETINGPGSWKANPWVWVVEFRKVSA